jgi:hypothetical protein
MRVGAAFSPATAPLTTHRKPVRDLYEVIRRRYERTSLSITSNRALAESPDPALAFPVSSRSHCLLIAVSASHRVRSSSQSSIASPPSACEVAGLATTQGRHFHFVHRPWSENRPAGADPSRKYSWTVS